jgi:hypothetical protein
MVAFAAKLPTFIHSSGRGCALGLAFTSAD